MHHIETVMKDNNMHELLISGDWGTTHCRLRLVARDSGTILADIRTGDGVQTLADGNRPARYRAVLCALLARLQDDAGLDLAGVPVLLSGMVGSTIGWHAVPYASLPVGLDGHGLTVTAVDTLPTGSPVAIVGGLRTDRDMLRGEETEAIGLLRHPAFAALRRRCLLILPGTHSKHLRIADDAIVALATHMTGELYAVLRAHSILRHSLPPAPAEIMPDALRAGIDAAAGAPVTYTLFTVRARQVLQDIAPAQNDSYLLGLLLGSELHDLRRQAEEDCPILLAANPTHAPAYTLALEHLRLPAQIAPPELVQTAAVAGHCALAELMHV
jgi:2-dehydro-3-deoxygalactonokinase